MTTVALVLAGTQVASAFATSRYATSSRLASGKWVRISIPETGVYQITDDELTAMGFSNPENVRLYGFGGAAIGEAFASLSLDDDLPQVPTSRYNGKLVFYGVGPVNFYFTDATSNVTTSPARYLRTMNCYSTAGYYFLAETGENNATITTKDGTSLTSNVMETSYDYFYHEKELVSPGKTGRQMLGEYIGTDTLATDFYLPNVYGTELALAMSLGVRSSVTTYAKATVAVGDTLANCEFSVSGGRMYGTSDAMVHYKVASPSFKFKTLTDLQERGQILNYIFRSQSGATIEKAFLDYIILTYVHTNLLGANGQMRMGLKQPSATMSWLIKDATSDLVVWRIDDAQNPVEYTTTEYEGGRAFAPGVTATQSQFIAFDPTQQLKSISGYETVDNQDLHAASTPDMLIVTIPAFHDQAQRLADLHIAEGMDVLVVDQQQVFNEFSSGTPDPMAVRMLCKMFWDRDAANNHAKFRYLLMFGQGTYDNRGVLGEKENMLITYETTNSNDENSSYVTDDFFGLLGDASGSAIARDTLCLGVGRITCRDVAEAKTDVDKIYKYVNEPDYGIWRNSYMTACDEGDDSLHIFQAEGISQLIEYERNTNMTPTKVYNELFPKAVDESKVTETKRTATEAKKHWRDLSVKGQYYMTYVGHGGPTTYTKYSHMWTATDVATTTMEHLPILSSSCCDVARYDSGSRGLAEVAFHKADGGAIAVVPASREVYANNNDRLDRGLARAIFQFDSTGIMPRLGDAYKSCKHVFLGESNNNKMSFFLLGDPAMKVNYPKPYFKVTQINGAAALDSGSTASVYPLQTVSVTAQVMTADGSKVNSDFNGDAYLQVYGAKKVYGTASGSSDQRTVRRYIYYERELLGESTGRVENGVFTSSVVLPRDISVTGDGCQVVVYAHQDDSEEMVNGQNATLTINAYNADEATDDTTAPTVTAMYLNDETTFTDGCTVEPSSTLYITATDDLGINMLAESIYSMSLTLDNGTTTYQTVRSYATASDEGKTVDIVFPLSDLEQGWHTLTYTVYDVAGNAASRTISFMVFEDMEGKLTTAERPAIDKATFDFTSLLSETPEVTVKVTDATGNLVWSKTTSSFPVEWNLTDNDGNRVPAGLYKYFGTYVSGTINGGTPIYDLIVVDPHF